MKWECDSDDLTVNVDPSSIGDALLNIVSNSIDANDKERGFIVIKAGKMKPGGDVRISIADNGKGIPGDILQKIFDPFFSTKGSKGTGLGLAVTRKIIEEHGGKLDVESTPGSGTTFTILLPGSVSWK